MAKKMMQKTPNMPKWAKVLVWILGIVVGLTFVTVIGLKIWVSTWKTYSGNEYSFKYPNGWYLENYVYRPEAIDIVQFSPQPGMIGQVVDFGKVSIRFEVDVDKKNTVDPKIMSRFMSASVMLGQGKYLYFSSDLSTADYYLITNDRVYTIYESINTTANSGALTRIETLARLLIVAGSLDVKK